MSRACCASCASRPGVPLDDKALAVLEFPAVLQRLARHTAFSGGREAALALRPLADREAVLRRQRQTAEAVRLVEIGVAPSLGGVHDVRETARSAGQGQVLTVSELLEVAGLARAAGRTRQTLVRVQDEAPSLATLAGGLAELGPLRALIGEAIDERGEVRDSASAELAAIRRERGVVHDRLQQRMEGLLRSPAVREALQDPIVTLREGRYVLPVRAEARSAVPGVVHDTSASGATIYVEPLAVVDLGNRWRELEAQERHEVERVLRELSAAVGEAANEIVDAVERLAALDLTWAKAALAAELGATALAQGEGEGAARRWLVEAPAELRLVEARHPLLEGEVVPVTIAVGGEYRALLITGPNTGGKTVALKTAGLLTLMALAGLPVPALEGSQVPVYGAVFADIGDEQSIEQSLSTFSGHITAIIDILERADGRSLVLLDELGAGTDPTEGAALAVAIVERLVALRASVVATTHHSELKLYAHNHAEVENASVEFDVETLAPTYRLRIGIPGQSNALAIAARLGMPGAIVEAAGEGLSRGQRDLEGVLAELRTQLAAAEDRAERAATERDTAEGLRRELEAQLGTLAEETAELRAEAHERVRAELRDAERMIAQARRGVEAARLEQAQADLDRAKQAAAALAPVEEAPAAPAPPPPGAESTPLTAGATVWLRGVSVPGEALSEPDEAGEFEVQLGALRTRVRVPQVARVDPPGRPGSPAVLVPPPPPVPEEIEVRGQRLDDALPAVEAFLDEAARAGRPRVRIIHGKGTGVLRQAVRDMLRSHPLVTGFEGGTSGEGGEGVTVATLAATRS